MIRTLTLVAAALLVASSASAQQWVPNSPSWNARYNCASQRAQALIRTGDPRWTRLIAKRRAGIDSGHLIRNTKDGQSITRDSDRYCAARGQ
jgi:hypothetical protein